MQNIYNPYKIEKIVQKFWQENNSFADTFDKDNNFYALSMFPYPSGDLHMGHVRNYTITDVISRVNKMKQKNVLHPMGWDAFGLPTENKAIETGKTPQHWTETNTAKMKKQLDSLGFSYDWSNELTTSSSKYYKLEQELFIQMYNSGLVYRKKSTVNWDPIDKTVLANEQVIDGKGWRSGATIEKKEMYGWFIRITDYADRLLDDLDGLDDWSEKVKNMQRNWIGKSQGVEVVFDVIANDLCDTKEIEVYTTRADTLLGVDYLVLSYEHPIMKQVVAENKNPTSELLDFVKQMSCTSVSEIDIGKAEKQGVFTGIYVTHPITNKKIPVWSANFVLMNYGTGAVMSVPAHDQRDYEFAKKYNLPISQVISPKDDLEIDLSKGAFEEKGVLINSGKYDGQTSKKAIKSIAFDLEKNGKGKITTNYRLRDWSVSRQRYWGSPIPMVYCEDCGIVAEKIENLPVKLPTEVELDGSGSPLSKMEGFANTPCPKCNKPAKRETDTFDTFFESSWYYINFACKDKSKLIDKQAQNLLPVDQYVGGVEHAILHLLYARFLFKVICDLNNIKKGSNEPFKKLLTQGMVLAETYFIKRDGKYQWFNPENVEVIKDKNGKIISAKTIDEGLEVEFGGINKMSKSKNNGIDPQDMIDSYGADSVRMFIMFAAPPEQTLEWSQDGVEGCFRFLKKFNGIVHKFLEENDVGSIKTPEQDKLPEELKKIRTKLHKGIAKIIDDLDRRYKFNTGIAQIMEIANTLQGIKGKSSDNIAVSKEIIESLILLLSPIAPHICHDLWAKFSDSDLITHPFPKVDSCALIESSIIMAVQINGKLRAKIQVSPDMKKEDIEKLALEQNGVIKFIGDSRIKKMIVVPNKIVNIVI